jgi:hypothetical protein
MKQPKEPVEQAVLTDEKNPTRFGEEFLNPRKDKF